MLAKRIKNLVGSEYNKVFWVLILLFCYLLIAGYYSGSGFWEQFFTGVSARPVGSDSVMGYGDWHEQLYRHTLPYFNFINDRPLYYSGYQFNLPDENAFSELWVFFPFNILTSVLAIFLGDTAAFNAIIVLSYPMMGFATFYMMMALCNNKWSSLVVSIFMVALPFRTAFLYSEVVYGLEPCLLPLLVLFTYRSYQTLKFRYYLLFGLTLFFLATSNFSLLYWYALLSSPYYLYVAVKFISKFSNLLKFCKHIGVIIISILPAIIYLIFSALLLQNSVLSNGQSYSELLIYSPELINIFTRYSGNEKTVYLGYTVIVMALLFNFNMYRQFSIFTRTQIEHIFIFIALAMIGYSLCFGPNFDNLLGIGFHKWGFDNIYGFSGTRTPGRLVIVVSVFYSIAFGLLLTGLIESWKGAGKKLIGPLLGLVLGVLIILDFDYLSPGMDTIDVDNSVIKKISGAEEIVLGLPIRFEAGHYASAIFQSLSSRNNIHFFNGHSSMGPKSYSQHAQEIFDINNGEINSNIHKKLKELNIKYVTTVYSEYPESIDSIALMLLLESRYLNLIGVENSLYLFEVLDSPRGEVSKIDRLNRVVELTKAFDSNYEGIYYLSGWYSREAYQNQRPYRWMKGVGSEVLILKDAKSIGFSYKCPGTELSLDLYGFDEEEIIEQVGGDGWITYNLKLLENVEFSSISFVASNTYSVPQDTRVFGCMISDLSYSGN